MVHHDVEKKCSLLSRFIVENLYCYSEKVRENLPIYLNTSEKVRVRVSRNSLTITDRTIWHNKIERVPISLIRECKVDNLSPKICYFANETVTNRYQIIVVLCKTADDSFKLTNVVQQKISSQGYYRAHNQWLQNGSFLSQQQQLTPKTKHKTIASVEVLSSPKQSSRLGWGRSQSRTLPQSSESIDKDESWTNKLSTGDLAKSSKRVHCQKVFESIGASQQSLTNSKKSSFKPPSMVRDPGLSDDAGLLHDQALASHADQALASHPDQALASHPSNSTLIMDQMTQQPDTELKSGSGEVQIVMRKARNSKRSSAVSNRGLCIRDTMRSSIVQYDSDGELEKPTEQLQHNSNGIARVVVGGNDSDSLSATQLISHSDDVVIKPAADEPSSTAPLPASNELPHADPDPEEQTSRTSGDGENSADLDKLLTNVDIVDNTSDGIYDNLTSMAVAGKTEYTVPTAEELLEGCDVSEYANNVISKPSSPTKEDVLCVSSDDEEEDYELVLTDLKMLTRGCSRQDKPLETRYPHQIIAAQSISQLSNSMSASQLSTSMSTSQLSNSQSFQNISKSLAAEKLVEAQVVQGNETPVCEANMREHAKKKLPRPQSTASGLHMIKANNELRRSTRRKGQYKSIAEYEKTQQGQGQMQEVKVVDACPSNRIMNRNSVCTSTLSTAPQFPAPLSPKSKRSSAINDCSTKYNRSISRQSSLNSINQSAQQNSTKNKHSFGQKLSKDRENGMTRRTSIISMSSAPNNIVLRRVTSSGNTAQLATSERSDMTKKQEIADRKSLSIDKKKFRLSKYNKANDEGVSQNGLTLIGSRNNLLSHGKSDENLCDSRRRREKPIMDASAPKIRSTSRTCAAERNKVTSLHWTPQLESKSRRRASTKYVSLPNTPELSFYRHQLTATSQSSLSDNVWEQNPGFKRFFDSILAYGPAGDKSVAGSKNKSYNQPDIVLESLTPEHSPRGDNSDSESSIRSSASAYWPPELKQQPNCSDDFEETASWKFHSPAGKNGQLINVS